VNTLDINKTKLPLCGNKPNVERNVWAAITTNDNGLFKTFWQQHRYHEARRWSVTDFINEIDFPNLTMLERSYIKNAGFAEITTKPGADRLTRQADSECQKWLNTNPQLSAVMQACGTWSRYWNEEESHHEMAFLYLSYAANENTDSPILNAVPSDKEIIDFRRIYPDDNMLRTLTILAMSEGIATLQYNDFADAATDPALIALFRKISLDESQHMRNFVSFAKALVDSGEFDIRDVLSMAIMFMREDGEIYGNSENRVKERDTHVNWWDAIDDNCQRDPASEEKEVKQIIFKVVENITGIKVSDVEELEEIWMELLVA